MKQPFAESVGAVSALDGAIAGSVRERPKRPRKPSRQPQDRSLTFFCSNPQCDHATWSPQDQARHMAREFWEVAQALVRLAPESAEALKLTGDVILRDLTDDECRDGHVEALLASRRGERAPLHVRLRANEYSRRIYAGTLEKLPREEQGARRRERHDRMRPDVVVLSGDERSRSAVVVLARLSRAAAPS